ncbi:MAG TPA: hypothetical protein VE913_23890 [Longimicrobium sp.]|nr:hypothetical protein [Longimicrobium sp.]
MSRIKPRVADLPTLDRAAHRVYPTQFFDELDTSVADTHLSMEHLDDVLQAIASISGITAVVEVEMVKTHVLHVGLESAPTWEELNRVFTPRERVSAVARSGADLLYWNILLSRFGPFWTGYWNRFDRKQGRVVAKLVNQGDSEEWCRIRAHVTAAFSTFGLREVPSELLDSRLSWLDVRDSHGTAHQRDGRGPSIYDAFFSDVY